MSICLRSVAALLAVAFLASAAAAQTSFPLTAENTKLEFVGSKKDGSHTGGFKTLTGAATVKGVDPATLAVNVSIDLDSMFTDNDRLTGHLKNPDFFDVKKFPKAEFKSTGVTKKEKGYELTGELTMHGKTNPVVIPAEISVTATDVKLTSKFTIDRTKWGMNYGKGMVNDEVAITLSVAAKK